MEHPHQNCFVIVDGDGGHDSLQRMDQPDMVAHPAWGQLNWERRENELIPRQSTYFPHPG